MKKSIPNVILMAFLALVLSSALAISGEVKSFSHQGIDRLYYIEGKANGSGEAQPVVVHLHGYRKKEAALAGQDTLDYIKWNSMVQLAVEENFLLVQPAALYGQWRIFPGLRNVKLEDGTELDDVGYIFSLVDHLIEKGLADRNRIYLTGISDGAIMSYHLLCSPNSPFAAAAAIVGTMYEKHMSDCHADEPPGLMVIAGTNDPILPYDGWIFRTGREVSVPETMDFWRRKHGCNGQKTKLLEDIDTTDDSRMRLVEWTGCKVEGSVKLFRAEGSGHAVPDFSPVSESWLKKSGGQNRDISSAKEAWKFFRRFGPDN
ncbi:MAG: hypothetical protein AAF423_03615 [Pseudomonadota bacterium]